MGFKISVTGVGEVRKLVDARARKRLKDGIDRTMEEGIDDMAETSYQKAPVETGALMHSILASVRKVKWGEYYYGSHMPYAQRQEYEHVTRRGYFRDSVNYHKHIIKENLEYTISARLG